MFRDFSRQFSRTQSNISIKITIPVMLGLNLILLLIEDNAHKSTQNIILQGNNWVIVNYQAMLHLYLYMYVQWVTGDLLLDDYLDYGLNIIRIFFDSA